MEQYKVTYSTQAMDDLRGIYAYICYTLSAPINARKQTNRIRNAIRGLNLFPNGHPIVDLEPWHSMSMHQLPVDNYLILYFVDDMTHTVDISRIFYGGRDLKAIAQNK